MGNCAKISRRKLGELFLEQLEPRQLLAFAINDPSLHPNELESESSLLRSALKSPGPPPSLELSTADVLRVGDTRNRPNIGNQRPNYDTPVLQVPWSPEKESISPRHDNGTLETAQYLSNLGTGPGDKSEVNILGSLGVTAREIPNRENDGAIQLANPTGLKAGKVGSVIARAKIGDGLYGSSGTGSGDYDYYRFSAAAGQLVSVNVEADSLFGVYLQDDFPADPIAALYDSAGNLLTYNDNLEFVGSLYAILGYYPDNAYGHFDPGFRFQIPANGDYYVAIFSSAGFQLSPFNPASGAGIYTESDYTVSITLESPTISSVVGEPVEDGAIPFAIETGIVPDASQQLVINGHVGDGLYGSAGTGSGDFDFFRLNLSEGQSVSLIAYTDPRLNSLLYFDDQGMYHSFGMDTKLIVHDAFGTVIAFSEDYQNFDGALNFVAPFSGNYFVSVSGYSGSNYYVDPVEYVALNFLADPFDPSSGGVAGVEGEYSLFIKTSTVPEMDMYSVDLVAGDLLSVVGLGGLGTVRVYDPSGQQVHFAYNMQNTWQVDNSPLYSGLGDAAFDRLISESGRYTIAVTSAVLPLDSVYPYGIPASPYNLNVRVFRPGLESYPVYTHQVLFLDFDGVSTESLRYNNYMSEEFVQPTVSSLTPMREFLDDYGFQANDDNAFIDHILEYVTDRLAADAGGAVGRGKNGEFLVTDRAGEFQVEILNSRDHQDYYMVYPNVSRVIVGSSWTELNDLRYPGYVGYIGIANSIDVGNYDLDDQSIALANETFFFLTQMLNDGIFSIATTASRLKLYSEFLAKVIVHEAGHNLGAFHTNQFDEMASIMDTSGAGQEAFAKNALGLGDDLIYGTDDDVKVQFSNGGTYDPISYPHGSINNSLDTVSFGLSTGTNSGTYFDFVTGTLYVTGSINDGKKDELKVRTVGNNIKVYINDELVMTRPAAGITRVVLNGSNDRDVLDATQFAGSATLQGKSGRDELYSGYGSDLLLGGPDDDILYGNAGNDVLAGGDGDDKLYGGIGADILFGGNGSDDLFGEGGGDLLIGARTSFDNNTTALKAIAAEWSSARSYDVRVKNLRGTGTGTGPRANGSYFLTTIGTSKTVFDDAKSDKLVGGPSRDWFFAKLNGNKKDQISGVDFNEWIDSVS